MWGATMMYVESGVTIASFNSRTPCGVRLTQLTAKRDKLQFQFTHPMWGATVTKLPSIAMQMVSIHAPHVGCDRACCIYLVASLSFNSRTPCGVRLLFKYF